MPKPTPPAEPTPPEITTPPAAETPTEKRVTPLNRNHELFGQTLDVEKVDGVYTFTVYSPVGGKARNIRFNTSDLAEVSDK